MTGDADGSGPAGRDGGESGSGVADDERSGVASDDGSVVADDERSGVANDDGNTSGPAADPADPPVGDGGPDPEEAPTFEGSPDRCDCRCQCAGSFVADERGAVDRRDYARVLATLGGLAALGSLSAPLVGLTRVFEREYTGPIFSEGVHLVDAAGERVSTDHLRPGERATVFPETHPGVDDAPTLLVRFEEDDDADVRQFAVEALAKVGGGIAGELGPTTPGQGASPDAGEVALAAADDDDPWVRAEAVVALDRLDRERYEDRLAAAVDDDHHAVRRNAAISLFKLRGEGAADLLVALADDESERVREWAAHLLAGVGGERAERTLSRLAGDDGEPHVVRSTAARSLDADPGAFRRQFSGAIDETTTDRPGESRLNRQPDL